jgi:hypothetical protein
MPNQEEAKISAYNLCCMTEANMEKVRVLRLIEYIGDREWVEETLSRSLKGTHFITKDRIIRCATLGDFPELIDDSNVSIGFPTEAED